MNSILIYVKCFFVVAVLSFCGNSTDLLGTDSSVITNESSQQSSQDLANITFGNVFLVNSAAAGEVVNVFFNIDNSSSKSIDANVNLGVFLKNSSGSESLLSLWALGALSAFQSISSNLQFTIPSATVAENYTLVFRADPTYALQESNEADNENHQAFSVGVRSSLTDLSAAIISHDRVAGSMTFRIYNGGSVDLNSEPFSYRIYLSQNNDTLEKGVDFHLATGGLNQAIGAGNFVPLVYNNALLSAPGGVPITLFVEVDSTEQIPEENEANNLAFLSTSN